VGLCYEYKEILLNLLQFALFYIVVLQVSEAYVIAGSMAFL